MHDSYRPVGPNIDSDGFYRLSAYEFSAGWVPGHDPRRSEPATRSPDPVTALERTLLPALQASPCIIGFSGGRDSSVILAVAVNLARREGLPLPIPVTNRYPGVPEAEESQWQELVIRHLEIDDWVRREFREELDLLGQHAQDSLRRHGVLWPATLHNRAPSIAVAHGGCYIDGEGGDEILGEFRITPITQALHKDRALDRDAVRKGSYALAPRRYRRRVETRRMWAREDRSWLRPAVADWYVNSSAEDEARLPLRYPAAVRRVARRRAVIVAMQNLDAMGRACGVRYVHPFYDPSFLAALGSTGGQFGHSGRTATMRTIFAGLLPDALLAREHKAYFNTAFIQQHSRAFLDSWDGTGLDADLIDVDALREIWSEPRVHAGTYQLMHAAWLATQSGLGSG
jgi:hypothetical protein